MISKKSMQLLLILSKGGCHTLQQLATLTNLSKNTVLSLLNEIDAYFLSLSSVKIHIQRKSGEGIRLVDNAHELNTVLVDLSKHSHYHECSVYDGRCMDEVLILLNEKEYVPLQDIAEKLYISKGTLINDLDIVVQILEMYNIQLLRVRNRGIKISGKESDIRKLFSDVINGKVNKVPVQMLTYGNINSLYSLFHKSFVDRVHELIMKIINAELELSDIQISAVLVHVMIAIQRIQNGDSLKMSCDNLDKIKKSRYYEISISFTKEIERMFQIHFDEGEVGYIALHLICSKQALETYDLENDEYNVIDEELKNIVERIVMIISEETKSDARADRELMDGLILHLKPAIDRIHHNLSLKNPYLDEIKKMYLPAFDMAIKISTILDHEYGIGYDENEIAYIALHVQAYLERLTQNVHKKKKVAVICATGIGSSQLVMARLRNYFQEEAMFESVSLTQIQRKEIQDQFDVILTTIPLNIARKAIYIDPFFENEQLKLIGSSLQQSNINEIKESDTFDIFKTTHIWIEEEKKTKYEVLQCICEQLTLYENVMPDFIESVIKREEIASTAYGNFAIPHGDVQLVKHSCIYVYVCKKGITWDNKVVNVVFLIALNKDKQPEFRAIFDHLYNIISDESKMSEILQTESINSLYKLMLGEL